MAQPRWNASAFILLMMAIAVAVASNSSSLDSDLDAEESGAIEWIQVPQAVMPPSFDEDDERQGGRPPGRPPRPPPTDEPGTSSPAPPPSSRPTPSPFTVTFYETGYCSQNNDEHSGRACRRKDRCCYCGGLGDALCQQICQLSNPRRFDAYNCDRCKCSCRYNRA